MSTVNLFAVFIKRPVATTLMTIAIALPGLLALKALPRAALPQVDYPTISISASLPGANPEVMAATVAAPLERAFSQLAGVDEMTSSSTQGSCRISLQFDLGRNIDGAARDVQAAINAARAILPKNIPSNPTYRRVNASASPILAIAVTSKIHTQDQLYDIAFSILNQKISQVNGVGQVSINGSSLRAVRVEVNPNVLNQYGISLEQVRTAISNFNQNRPKGSIQSREHYWQIEVNDQAKRAADYRGLIVAFRNQAPVRLQDVAQVTDSIQELRSAGTANGKPTIVLVIYSQPGTNVVETVDTVRNLLPKLKTMIPAAVDMEVMIDRSKTVRKSLSEVQHTLYISIALVILVTFAFLRNARATLIPTITIPVALLGTLTVIYLLGYSLNNLSLMALIISASFVVDDAIVVVENTAKHLESGMEPMPAALKGIQEVGFTVLAMSLSLIAVFVPLLFMDGILGRLFREFAVTLSVAVLISLFVSLSTTPMLCARILRPHAAVPQKRRWHFLIVLLDMPFWVYQRTLGWCLRHGWLMVILLFAVIALNIHLYQIVPKGFFPQQDTGNLRGSIQADQSLSFSQVRKRIEKLTHLLMKDPDIEVYYEFSGSGGSPQSNMGSLFAKLRPLGERTATASEVVSRLRPKLMRIPGISMMLNPQQDLQVGARMGGSQFQYTLLADNLDALKTLIPKLRGMMSKLPQIVDVNTDFQTQGLALKLEINREAAARYGITPSQIDDALNSAFSQRLVSTIYEPLNQYYVVLTLSPAFQKNAEAIEQIYIDTPNNGKVPLMAISHWQLGNTPMAVNHQGQFVAGTISFNLADGYSLDQATQAIETTFDKLGAPDNINGVFAGAAKVFKASLDSQPWLIMTALLTVYIVLGILYESFIHPLTIISTLPSAGVGALLALILFKSELSIIALIGVILLVGIVMKNAIMMIDCALQLEREQGMTPFDSIKTACLQRFRPILMTTLAAMLGALPLALGAGDGSEIRRPLGISIVGGLVFSQLLTLYTTPVVYLYLDRCRHAFNQRFGWARQAFDKM